MADVSSLGEYKVVVTADYSQLKTQFQAMSDYVTKSTKAMTDGLNKAMEGVNATMVTQLKASVDQLKKAFEGLSDAPKKAGDGFKTYTQQIKEAQREAEKAHQRIQEIKADMEQGINPRTSNTTSLQIMQQEFEKARLKVDQLKDAQLDFKNRVDKTTLAAKELDKALVQAGKDEQNLMKQNASMLQGQMRAAQQVQASQQRVDNQRQALSNRQSQRIAHLQTQYRVAYEEINKYIQSHTKMSEAVFIRLQGRITAIGNELRNLHSIPPMPNPLEGMDFDKYSGQFSRFGDAIQSLKHHLTWMASAVAIGGLVGLPVVISEATKEFEALNTKIMQNLELADQYRNNHSGLSADVQRLGEVAQNYAKGFGMSVGEVQEAMQVITRRFKDVNTATYLTGIALKMSRLDFVDTGKSARDLESVLLQFGMGARDAGKFLNDFSVLLHTARINGTEMLDALERSGSAFRALNMNVSEAMAAIATLSTATGLTGSTIGMTFKSIATNLDTKKGREALEALNIKLYEFDDTGKKVVRNGAQIIMELQDAFKNLNEEGQRNLAYLIAGGKYQANAAMALLRDTGGNFRKYLADMKELSSDAMTDSLLEKSLNTYATGIERFKASVTVLAQTIGGMLLPVMEGIVYAGIGITEMLTQNADTIAGTITVLGQLALAFVAVKASMMTWGVITTIASMVTNAFFAIRGALTGVTIAQLGVTAVTGAYNIAAGISAMASTAWGIAAGILSGHLTLQGLATVAAASATALLDAALLPLIGTVAAVVAAIALLVAGLYEVVTHWDEYAGLIKDIWNELVAFIANAVELIIDCLSPLIIALYALYEVVRTVFVKLVIPAVQWAAQRIGQLLDWIKEKLGIHAKGVQGILGWIAGRFQAAVKWIHDNVSASFAAFLDSTIGQLIRAAQKISNIASQIQKAIKNAFTIGGDTSVSVDGGSVGSSSGGGGGQFEPNGSSWGDFKRSEGNKTEKGFLESFFDGGLEGLTEHGKSILGDLIGKTMGEAWAGMTNDADNPYNIPPEMLRGYDDLGAGGGKGGKGTNSKSGRSGAGAKEADNSIEAMLYRHMTKSLGLSHAQAVGELANIQQESGFNYQSDNGSRRGLYQFDSTRWAEYQNWLANTGRTDSAVSQVDYRNLYESKHVAYEAQMQQAYLQSGATTPEEYAAAFNKFIERSGEVAGDVGYENRMRNARELDARFARKNGEENFDDVLKARESAYKQLYEQFDREVENLKTERAKIGQGVSADEKRKIFEKVMGVGEGKPNAIFAEVEKAQKDYAKILLEVAKEEAKRADAVEKATDRQVAAIDKMADAEVAFAEKLGLMSKKDVIEYQYRKNERNYSTQKPVLDAKLGATVDMSKGSYDDMLEAYRGLIYAQNALEAEHFAQKLMYLSRDVEATKKALDEEMNLEESYQSRRQELEREAYEYKARYTIGFIDSVASNVQSNLEAMLNGTKSFGEGVRDIFKGIVNDIIKMFTEDLAKRLKGWLAKALHITKGESPLGANPGKALLGSLAGGGGKSKGGGIGGLLSGVAGGKGGGMFGNFSILDALMPRNTMKLVQKQMNQLGNMMKSSLSGTYSSLSSISQSGLQNISNNMQVNTDMMGMSWEQYKQAQVTTNEVGDNAIVAQNQTTAATVRATTATMMSWLMLVLGLFALFGGSKKSKTSNSTSSENLGRAPDSYYMTPMPVMQSTNYSVPSMDIGGNIEQDMLIFAHKNEMVLTPEQADVIRNTAKSGGSIGGGSGANATVKSNISVSTVDSKGFDRVLRNYNRDLSRQVRKGIRNGYLTTKGLL